MLGSYLVHDYVKKYDDASEDAFYEVEELTALVNSSFVNNMIMILDKFTQNVRF